MSKIRSGNTGAEKALCKVVSKEFYPRGWRYRRNYRKVIGKPDIAFVSKKIAIFVDGEFWHGYNLTKKNQIPPKEYWLPKIKRNMQRDKEVNRELTKLGWTVLRFWEYEVRKSPQKVISRISRALDSRS